MPICFQKTSFFSIFNKDCTFYTKTLVLATKDAQSIVKIRFLVTFFTFLSVIRQNFEYNLRILANFCVKTQKYMISNVHFRKSSFFLFFKKHYTFCTKNLFFTAKDAKSVVKIRFLVTFFTFLSVIRQNFEYNLNFSLFSRKNSKIYDFDCTFSKN